MFRVNFDADSLLYFVIQFKKSQADTKIRSKKKDCLGPFCKVV